MLIHGEAAVIFVVIVIVAIIAVSTVHQILDAEEAFIYVLFNPITTLQAQNHGLHFTEEETDSERLNSVQSHSFPVKN